MKLAFGVWVVLILFSGLYEYNQDIREIYSKLLLTHSENQRIYILSKNIHSDGIGGPWIQVRVGRPVRAYPCPSLRECSLGPRRSDNCMIYYICIFHGPSISPHFLRIKFAFHEYRCHNEPCKSRISDILPSVNRNRLWEITANTLRDSMQYLHGVLDALYEDTIWEASNEKGDRGIGTGDVGME